MAKSRRPKAFYAAVSAAVLVCACGSGVSGDASISEVGPATPMVAVPTGSLDLGAADVAAVRGFVETIPDELPDHARPSLVFFKGQGDGKPVTPVVDGTASAVVVAMSFATAAVDASLLCFVNGRHTPCSPDVPVGTVLFAPDSAVELDLRVPAADGDAVHVVMLVHGDDARPEPASLAVRSWAGSVGSDPEPDMTLPAADEVLGGCDVTAVTLSTERKTTFTPTFGASRDQPMWLAVERCDPTPETVFLVAVADRRTAVADGSGVWATAVRLEGKSAVVEVAPSMRTDADRLQFGVLRTDESGRAAWMTHEVVLNG